MDAQPIPEIPVFTIILFGKTGVGKSYLANIIAGQNNLFKVGENGSSTTSNFVYYRCYLQGNKQFPILIIDSPGYEDNTNLTTSDIYKMFIKFLLQNKLSFNLILFCIQQAPNVVSSVFEELRLLTRILGPESLKFLYVTVTQVDLLSEQSRGKIVKSLAESVPRKIKEKIENFDQSHVLIPGKDEGYSDFFNFIKDCLALFDNDNKKGVQVTFNSLDQSQPIKHNMIINALLTIEQDDANKELRLLEQEEIKLGFDKKHRQDELEEKVLLIDIIQDKKGDNLPTILSFLRNSSSPFLKDIYLYFTTEKSSKTLVADFRKIFEKFKSFDKSWRVFEANFKKDLLQELDKNLPKIIMGSLGEIIKAHLRGEGQRGMKIIQNCNGSFVPLASANNSVITSFMARAPIAFGAGLNGYGIYSSGLRTSGALSMGFILISIIHGMWWSKEETIKNLPEKLLEALLDTKNRELSEIFKDYIRMSCINYYLNLHELNEYIPLT